MTVDTKFINELDQRTNELSSKKGFPNPRLKALLGIKGITISDFARTLGKAIPQVHSWAVGKYVPRDEMKALIASQLGVSSKIIWA